VPSVSRSSMNTVRGLSRKLPGTNRAKHITNARRTSTNNIVDFQLPSQKIMQGQPVRKGSPGDMFSDTMFVFARTRGTHSHRLPKMHRTLFDRARPSLSCTLRVSDTNPSWWFRRRVWWFPLGLHSD